MPPSPPCGCRKAQPSERPADFAAQHAPAQDQTGSLGTRGSPSPPRIRLGTQGHRVLIPADVASKDGGARKPNPFDRGWVCVPIRPPNPRQANTTPPEGKGGPLPGRPGPDSPCLGPGSDWARRATGY